MFKISRWLIELSRLNSDIEDFIVNEVARGDKITWSSLFQTETNNNNTFVFKSIFLNINRIKQPLTKNDLHEFIKGFFSFEIDKSLLKLLFKL